MQVCGMHLLNKGTPCLFIGLMAPIQPVLPEKLMAVSSGDYRDITFVL